MRRTNGSIIEANAGAEYTGITSKHHDGFSIYRSKDCDYDMEITPNEGDPLKDLADVNRRKGFRRGFYHFIMDSHHPDYRRGGRRNTRIRTKA